MVLPLPGEAVSRLAGSAAAFSSEAKQFKKMKISITCSPSHAHHLASCDPIRSIMLINSIEMQCHFCLSCKQEFLVVGVGRYSRIEWMKKKYYVCVSIKFKFMPPSAFEKIRSAYEKVI
jgi:hypothetical protein